MPQSTPRAIRVFGIGCEEGNADSCAEAARLLIREAQSASGGALLSSTSTSAPPPAPLLAGEAVAAGRGHELASASLLQAHDYLRRGCNGGFSVPHAKCCGMLGMMYTSSRLAPSLPTPTNRDLLDTLERACTGEQPGACMRLAALYSSGSEQYGVSADPPRAAEYEKRGLVWAGMTEAQATAAVAAKRERAGMGTGMGTGKR